MLIVARREVSESLSGSENGARQELLPPTQAPYGTEAAAADALDRVAGMIKKAVYRSSPGPGRRRQPAGAITPPCTQWSATQLEGHVSSLTWVTS